MSEHEHPFQADTDRQEAERYRQARDLCGGEDPVEWIGRAQRGLYALQEQLKHRDASCRQWQEEAEKLESDRTALLDLVQRLLDHRYGPDGFPWELHREAQAKVDELRKEKA